MEILERRTLVTIKGITEEEWYEVKMIFLEEDAEEEIMLRPFVLELSGSDMLDGVECSEGKRFYIWAGYYYRNDEPHSFIIDQSVLEHFQGGGLDTRLEIEDRMTPVIANFLKKLKTLPRT